MPPQAWRTTFTGPSGTERYPVPRYLASNSNPSPSLSLEVSTVFVRGVKMFGGIYVAQGIVRHATGGERFPHTFHFLGMLTLPWISEFS